MNLTTTKDIVKSYEYIKQLRIEKAKVNMLAFARYNMPTFQATEFHKQYYSILDKFTSGEIKKLIISVPPQHGKSLGSSVFTPSYLVGNRPDNKIAIVCYSSTKARKFGRKIKQVMSEPKYNDVFDTRLATRKDPNYVNTGEEMEIVGHDGSLKMVGYEGGLTGDPVDILLMDDLYKDWKEANSPVVRDNVWDWYVTVADTRLHNDSQQLIVFTRWHEDDLIGRIEKIEQVTNYADIDDFNEYEGWVKINFEAIKASKPTFIDPREKDEALWPERHSYKKLMLSKSKDPVKFDALYQGNPLNKQGRLYGKFKTYTQKPEAIIRKSYCDTADTGTDNLLNISYDVDSAGYCYVVDVYYTDKPVEVTEPEMVNRLNNNKVSLSDIESNNGGRIFALNLKNKVSADVKINWFHQSENKEARCISGASNVMEYILMPDNWFARWPDFYSDVTNFSRVFKSNVHDEVADVLTGISERRLMFTPTTESLFIKC